MVKVYSIMVISEPESYLGCNFTLNIPTFKCDIATIRALEYYISFLLVPRKWLAWLAIYILDYFILYIYGDRKSIQWQYRDIGSICRIVLGLISGGYYISSI